MINAAPPKQETYVPNLAGRCSPRLAEEVSRRLGVPVAKAMSVLEDLARELPNHIKIDGVAR